MSLQKKLNGELRKEVDDFKKDMMILKNDNIREITTHALILISKNMGLSIVN